ncbi:MAG: hypothetical protein QOE64_1460 [Frankiales bacterium]|jgi:hypothetical protein|nr:hypothetical protein [Frankiales bacterium]
MAGYSSTPLPAKLGIKSGHRVLVDNAPQGFALDGVQADVRIRRGEYDVALVFCPDLARLEKRWAPVAGRMTPAGALWVAWPKRASKVPTDLTEDVVRDLALSRGLVDVKVCAVDDVWSALKLVTRLVDR